MEHGRRLGQRRAEVPHDGRTRAGRRRPDGTRARPATGRWPRPARLRRRAPTVSHGPSNCMASATVTAPSATAKRIERRAPVRLPQPPRDRAVPGGDCQAQRRRAGQPDVLDRRVERRDQRVAVGVLQHVVGAVQRRAAAGTPGRAAPARAARRRRSPTRGWPSASATSGASRPRPSAAGRPRSRPPSATPVESARTASPTATIVTAIR